MEINILLTWNKILLTLSGLIILITTLLWGIFIKYKNIQINKLQNSIEDVSEKMGYHEFNMHHHSNQLSKLSSSLGTYSILKDLKLPSQSFWEERVKAQYIQAIKMLGQEKINTNDLSKMEFESLESTARITVNIEKKEYSKLVGEKKRIKNDLRKMIWSRDFWSIITVILQGIGLFLGMISQFII
ncbi:MAG: hypothetical protein AABY07_09980 [Nanoarchaeota archaeon]